MELTDRDYLVLRMIHKFRFCLGRHIKALTGFNGQRSTDRRLKMLLDSGYLERKKYMYGLPYLYTLTHKGRILLGVNKRKDIIRIEKITHDICVIETLIYCIGKHRINLSDIESEKELNIKNGFGARRHQPDFVFTNDGKKYAVEVELSSKNKDRLEKNIRDNFLNFDAQYWVTGDSKVKRSIEDLQNAYSNIVLLSLMEVQAYVKR